MLDQHQKDFTNQIIVNAQSQLEKLYQHDYKNQLKKSLSASIIKYATTALTGYRDTITEQQLTLEEEAVGTYQITFDKFLQTKLADLNQFTTEEKPILKEILTTTVGKITDTVQQYDTDQRALVDKYWLPITKIVEEYSTTTIGNLNAVKTAIGSILDQVSLNVTTGLTNFKDDGGNLLNVTTQAFDREKSILNEQVTQGLTEMQEACLVQLQDTRKLLELLGEDMTIQQTTLDAEKEVMVSEIEESAIRNLSTIQETADAFTKDLQSKVQSIEEQIQEEIKKTQELIIQQGTNLAETLIPIQGQLSDFSQNQIQSTQEIIEDISSTTTLKIDDFRKAIEKQLETFALMLTEETEDYVSTLRQEIVQLQTVATKLNEKIGKIGEAIETKFEEQIEGSIVNLHAALEEQQVTLSNEISTMFQTFTDQFEKIQGELQQSLTQESQVGQETLDESFGQLSNLLDEKTTQLSLQNEKAEKTQLNLLERQLEPQQTIIQETLSNVHTKSSNNLDQFTKMVTELLTLQQRELEKATTASWEAWERESTKFSSNLGKDVEQMFQNQRKELDLVKTRLTRVTSDWLRSATEILQNFKESTLTDISQKSDAITLSFKQIVDTAEEGIITQTKQSGRRISQNLGKERQTLKTEYQTLTKEITAKAKETETISLNALQGFTEKTDPIIKRLQTQTQDTKNILIGIWDSLSDLQPSETERTWRIVTCEGIQNHLLFMFRRVKDTITLVYPHFDEIPVNELSRVSPETRVHVITKLDGERQRTAALKLLKQGNIRIWNNPQMDFYGGSRDGEEVLIAPIHDDREEIVAIVSDQESYISLFNQTLGPRWISTSREIRPGS